jgi:hypothetical protein
VQVQYLFKEFEDQQKLYKRLQVVSEPDDVLDKPEKDASAANFPLPERRRDFIKKAMSKLKEKSIDGVLRLRWASFDKEGFERLLSKFVALNDSMTDILDARLQVEIHHTVQDTNRGMLQLHGKIADLSRLVMALNLKLEGSAQQAEAPMSTTQKEARAADASGLKLLSQLAKFKAFNESIESEKQSPLDDTTSMCLELGTGARKNLMLSASMIQLKQDSGEDGLQRCEALLTYPDGRKKRVWVEWKEYDSHMQNDALPPKPVILERVRKLAALLNHSPKPEAFRTPHCLGFFDQAELNGEDSDDDVSNLRLGLVFERPEDDGLHTEMPPVSLRQLLERDSKTYKQPRVTDRVRLAHAIGNCLLVSSTSNKVSKELR